MPRICRGGFSPPLKLLIRWIVLKFKYFIYYKSLKSWESGYGVQNTNMILEVAILNLKPGMTSEFEANFRIASTIIASMPGYISHELQRCLETENRYILLVRWQKLEDHTIGFRQSPEYQKWRSQLHHFYEPFPTVEHYQGILDDSPIDR